MGPIVLSLQFSLKITLLLLSFLLFSQSAYAATLQLNPGSGNYTAEQTFTAQVRVNPSGESVNAVEATLNFDTDALQVVNVSQEDSVFTLWTTEPTFSNSAGTITFGGGSPSPFTAPSTVLTVTFRAVGSGEGSVTFSSASVLAADGQGSDVFESGSPATFTVAEAIEPSPPPQPETPTPTPQPETQGQEDEEALTFGDPPRTPEIGSQTFLDATQWYADTEGLFTWTLPFDITAVAISVSTSSEVIPHEDPDAIFDPPIDEFAITDEIITEDGEWYVNISYQNQVGWGSVLNRMVRIDTTPPEPFEIEIVPGPDRDSFPTLRFEAEDVTSGIDFYELFIAGGDAIRVTPDEAELGYLLSRLEDGTYTVRVVAHDMAGNTRESSTPVLITAGWTPPTTDDEEGSFWDFFTFANITIMILLVIIILLVVYIWYDKRIAKTREERLRRETREIQDQTEKIFSALRDEIYDQIKAITKRKRLSQSEKEAVEGLNQALEVSETLIEKEINDVNTILK